ncbi:MAG TPA: hypothetical protein VGG40_00970, partial [Solirubrobacterales bacterium]
RRLLAQATQGLFLHRSTKIASLLLEIARQAGFEFAAAGRLARLPLRETRIHCPAMVAGSIGHDQPPQPPPITPVVALFRNRRTSSEHKIGPKRADFQRFPKPGTRLELVTPSLPFTTAD